MIPVIVCIRFMVWILEKGRQQYGVGVSSQMHAIVDRYPPRYTYGAAGGQISAMSKLPLIKNAIGTLKVNLLFIF